MHFFWNEWISNSELDIFPSYFKLYRFTIYFFLDFMQRVLPPLKDATFWQWCYFLFTISRAPQPSTSSFNIDLLFSITAVLISETKPLLVFHRFHPTTFPPSPPFPPPPPLPPPPQDVPQHKDEPVKDAHSVEAHRSSYLHAFQVLRLHTVTFTLVSRCLWRQICHMKTFPHMTFCHLMKFLQMLDCHVEKFSTWRIVMWNNFSTWEM